MNWKILTEMPDQFLLAKWDAFLADANNTTHYTTPNFFVDPFIRGGKRFCILTFDKTNRITSVLSGISYGRKVQSGLATRPQLTFRNNIDRSQATAALLQGLRAIAGDKPELIDIYSWEKIGEFEDSGFQMRKSNDKNAIVVLDLSMGADEIFKRFSQTRRNEIRKTIRKNELKVKELETHGELAELYKIHKTWNRQKGNEPDIFEDMKLAFEQRNHRKIFIAKYENKIIAGSYYRYCKGGIVEYAANNSLVEFQNMRPNDLIGWKAIEWACNEGFSLFSMGGSHLFLRRFGGEIHQTYHYRLDTTFLKRHNKMEELEQAILGMYFSLPVFLRDKVKRAMVATKT